MAQDLLRARVGWRAVYCFQCVGSWVQLPEPQRKKAECTQHTQMSPETVGFIFRPPGPMQICRALLRNDQLSKHTLIWLVQSIKWRHLLCTQKHHEQANKHPTAVPNSRLHRGCFVWFLYHFQSWKVNIYIFRLRFLHYRYSQIWVSSSNVCKVRSDGTFTTGAMCSTHTWLYVARTLHVLRREWP